MSSNCIVEAVCSKVLIPLTVLTAPISHLLRPCWVIVIMWTVSPLKMSQSKTRSVMHCSFSRRPICQHSKMAGHLLSQRVNSIGAAHRFSSNLSQLNCRFRPQGPRHPSLFWTRLAPALLRSQALHRFLSAQFHCHRNLVWLSL